MNKPELIKEVSDRAYISVHQASIVVDYCFGMMIRSLYNDERIEIRGLGSFENRNYKSYPGRNPMNGEPVIVIPKKTPFFKAGREVKRMINIGKID